MAIVYSVFWWARESVLRPLIRHGRFRETSRAACVKMITRQSLNSEWAASVRCTDAEPLRQGLISFRDLTVEDSFL